MRCRGAACGRAVPRWRGARRRHTDLVPGRAVSWCSLAKGVAPSHRPGSRCRVQRRLCAMR